MSPETLIVLTTCGNADDARALAQALVERRLAACVNTVGDITSVYRWRGRIEHDQETLLIIKTTAERFVAVENAIRELSKYELPEVLALPVTAGAARYLDWVRESVTELKD